MKHFAYNPKSLVADEFICHDEIIESLKFAHENKDNLKMLEQILEKAAEEKGLSHREALLLLASDIPDINKKIETLAKQIKLDFYGNRIVLFAPLYLSNYCVNGCTYCPYHAINKNMPRKKMTQDEIRDEVIALQDMGHKRLALELGEHPQLNPLDYVLESIDTIYNIKHKNGSIRRVNVNIAATNEESYAKLKDAGIGTYILFQETYNRERYEKLHPTGPKHDYNRQTEAMDRAMRGGIDDVGIGVLFGLSTYLYEFTALLMHVEHLKAVFNVGPHTISVPRLRPADGINPQQFADCISDDIFVKIVACLRVAVPTAGMIVSTRESKETRERVLELGISQISGGSKTSVGGYSHPTDEDKDSAQFDICDNRTLDEVVYWLLENGHIPSFCTACYRKHRTGEQFMKLCANKSIHHFCHPNALLSLQEYLTDYASPATKALGEKVIAQEVAKLPVQSAKFVLQHLEDIKSGKGRDFYL